MQLLALQLSYTTELRSMALQLHKNSYRTQLCRSYSACTGTLPCSISMAFNRTASLPSRVQRLESKTTVSHRLVICQCLHWQKPLNAGYLCLIDVGLFRKSEAQRMRSIRSKKYSNTHCSGHMGWVYEFNERIIWTVQWVDSLKRI